MPAHLLQVKLEAHKQQLEQAQQQQEASTPSDSGRHTAAETEPRRRVDISELSWQDRERVLRLLFAKINNQQQQAAFSNLPQHPLHDKTIALQGTATDAGPAVIV